MVKDALSPFNTANDKNDNAQANRLHRLLIEEGVNFASGVPCGVLRHIIENLNNDRKIIHVPANRESEAVGLAAGAYLSGKIPVVYMQNSGLFTASNDIASLLVPYRIPIFFVVSYRGCEGEDAVQHLVTGQATEGLLTSLGLPYVVFGKHSLEDLVHSMFAKMRQVEASVALLLKRGWNR
jgi:sulfopyruvate decarboxylase alpha subunit